MPVPVTFSAPEDPTFPSLDGYSPSIEDSLRYAVWLMLMADTVNARTYSYVADDPTAGVRITQGQADHDPATLQLILPQQLVSIAVASGTWKYSTSRAGEKRVTIGIMHIAASDSSGVETDVSAPGITPETRLARIERILMRGTLYSPDQDSESASVVDPYRTPLLPDGTYDPANLVFLSHIAPDIRPTAKNTFANRRVRSESDLYTLDPVRDFAVAYGLLATYTIDVANRDNMR